MSNKRTKLPTASESGSIKPWIKQGLSSMQLGASLGKQVLGVVEAVHANVTQPSLPITLGNKHAHPTDTRGLTRLVYQTVRGGFDLTEWSLKRLVKLIPDDDQTHQLDNKVLQVIAAVNGVFGDLLAANDNELAIDMQWITEHAVATTGNDQQRPASSLVLFIHGLCMSEQAWQNPNTEAFIAGLRTNSKADMQLNQQPDIAYLRYNTGRHISLNGRQLAELIETKTSAYAEVNIIGHSMGGLLTQSACYYANEAGFSWPKKLCRVVTLGTPYHGAPLERLGNAFNSLFLLSPYSASFANLGNLRSAGIRDLRHGNVLDTDWTDDETHHEISQQNVKETSERLHDKHDRRTVAPLQSHVHYLLIAATRSNLFKPMSIELDVIKHYKHDLLVQVSSALGLHHDADKALASPGLTRQIVPNTDHMQLLHSEAVYALVNDWWPGAN